MEDAAIRHGVYVTAAYILVFKVCLIGQTVSRKRLLKAYRARGEFVSIISQCNQCVLPDGRRIGGTLLQASCPCRHVIEAWISLSVCVSNMVSIRVHVHISLHSILVVVYHHRRE